MATIISNISSCKNAGILADRNGHSESLNFRKFNLIYGFNGSGKSTLSRIFASLELGEIHPKLPKDCTFEVTLSDGASYGVSAKPTGLERRLVVFNSDFAEKNFQWSLGTANPVFFIGKEQAEAYKELENIERDIVGLISRETIAEAAEQQAAKALALFKRDRAKVTAAHLHLGSRKYEAPQLTRDYELWSADETPILIADALKAAEDLRRASEPMAEVREIQFDDTTVPAAFRFISDMCAQSLGTVALEEIEKFPEALLWVKQGHEFHTLNEISTCLLCGNEISQGRRNALNAALDDTIDQFIHRLNKTSARLTSVIAYLGELGETTPHADAFYAGQADAYKEERVSFMERVNETVKVLEILRGVLNQKLSAPATPIDLTILPDIEAVDDINARLMRSVSLLNAMIAEHNNAVKGFQQAQADAETAIRKHFVGECRTEFGQYIANLESATNEREVAQTALRNARQKAAELRQTIRTHGPAADAINKIVKSYLGHGELTIHAIEEGYEIHRHGAAIEGLPSEGEKTAISIAYFLSTIEADGKKLKDAIVVIDDPVSSLDTKALNYACSLVRTRLSGVCQLFILTHNQQCMNEFRKHWKSKAKAEGGKEPTATLHFIDVSIPEGQIKRSSKLITMPSLLRDYDSEYHFLFGYVLRFRAAGDSHFEHGYMMPNVLRRVLDIFLAFKCPGTTGLPGKIDQLCKAFPDLDKDRLVALERLTQVESHSDNLDDLISFSSMTIEETRDAAAALLEMMGHVDGQHLRALTRLCN